MNIETYLTEIEKRRYYTETKCTCGKDVTKLTAMLREALSGMRKHLHAYHVQNYERNSCDVCIAFERIEKIAGGVG